MIYLYVTIWYLIGLGGCALATHVDIANGEDFTLQELILMIIFSLTGPVIAFVALCYYFDKSDHIVLIKGKKK